MRITNRDKNILMALNKLRVLDIETVTSLCGFTQYCKCANRLAILYENGYVNYNQQGITCKKYYYITQKGMNTIFPGEERISKKGKRYIYYNKPPTFRQNNVNHEVLTGKVLSFVLKCNPELTIEDFKTDRDMMACDFNKRKMFKHFSDLQCEKYRIKIEVELTRKNIDRLRRNISYNSKSYVQVWIAGSTSVYNVLIAEKKRYPQFQIYVIKMEKLEEEKIILSDLYNELLGKNPQLLEKIKEIEMLKIQRQKKQTTKAF